MLLVTVKFTYLKLCIFAKRSMLFYVGRSLPGHEEVLLGVNI